MSKIKYNQVKKKNKNKNTQFSKKIVSTISALYSYTDMNQNTFIFDPLTSAETT